MGYMAPDLDFFPAALMNDGLLDIMSVDGDVGISKAFEIGKGIPTGHHVEHPLVGYRKVVAYRVIPRHDKGYLSIDGEKYPFAPFQAEVHRGLCRVISRRGVFEAPPPKDWETAGVAK
jgi:sphingosine kinase